MSEFDNNVRRYVELLVKQGANVQPDQQVLILAEPSCLELADIAAEFCYEQGARYVDVNINLPRVARYHLLSAPPNRLTYTPTHQTVTGRWTLRACRRPVQKFQDFFDVSVFFASLVPNMRRTKCP